MSVILSHTVLYIPRTPSVACEQRGFGRNVLGIAVEIKKDGGIVSKSFFVTVSSFKVDHKIFTQFLSLQRQKLRVVIFIGCQSALQPCHFDFSQRECVQLLSNLTASFSL